MGENEILKELNHIFIDVLDNDTITINGQTTVFDIEQWDSLTHVQLVNAIEKHFKIKFTAMETQTWSDVGEMANSILKKLKS